MSSKNHITPEEFIDYLPEKCATITSAQAKRLADFIRSQNDQYMLVYIWRFAFGMDNRVIQRYAKCDNINGIVEAFRYACKRYLTVETPISDAGMAKAFAYIMQDYEVMLLSAREGICWLSGKTFDYTATIREALHAMEERRVMELERKPLHKKFAKLDDQQIRSLSKHILDLPAEYGRILRAYCIRCRTCEEIEEELGIRHVRGRIEFLREVLTEKMCLPLPIHDSHIKQAMESYTFIGFRDMQNMC